MNRENGFDNKRIVITGGVKGVGKAIAQTFARHKAHLILNYFHSHDEAKRLAAELAASGIKVDVIRASVAREDQVNRMFDEIKSRFGTIDVLINNAAHGSLVSNDELTDEDLDRAMNTNFRGALWCSRRAADLMPQGGAIVNLSSVGSQWVVANYLSVGTSKAALESLTRYHAVEFAPRGIRVNAVSGTLIDGSVANSFPDSVLTKQSAIQATPLKRLALEAELANVVEFLASPAASWITGQVIVADGGLTLSSEALGPRTIPPVTNPVLRDNKHPAHETIIKPDLNVDALADDAIVVVAMGLALPGANTAQDFWNILENPLDLFGIVPKSRWDYTSFYDPNPSAMDKSYQANSVFITEFEPHAKLAEEIKAGTAPEEMTTRWLRHAVLQALDGTKIAANERAAFYVGYTADGSQHLEEAMVLSGLEQRAKNAKASAEAYESFMNAAQGRYHRGSKGFSQFLPHRVGIEAIKGLLSDDTDVLMVDTACSSSLYSIDMGRRALMQGEVDVAICGGAFGLGPRGKVMFSKLNGLSRGGRVRSLDKSADGVLFADGAAVIVLKTKARAAADGDKVLGVIETFGGSSDGKGKAIYAPSTDGQAIAIARAYTDDLDITAQDIDWVIAHATGTPAGDLAEMDSLRRMFAGEKPINVTSNKSLIGHTGWAAGVTSVIQALLSLEHGRISKQYRFESPPTEFKLDTSNLRVPVQSLPWPANPHHRRRAAISGFGFGGTNGHLVVSEPPQAGKVTPTKAPTYDNSPLVIVGWSAVFPGLNDKAAIEAWLKGGAQAPERSFGKTYPLPPFDRVRMPPSVLRILDRCQLMALDAAHELREALQAFWSKNSDDIAIMMGHMGGTGNAALYATRCYMDDLEKALTDKKQHDILDHVRADIQAAIAPTSENSFPGMMPNVIPARIANYYDLHGPNMTLDMGHASFYAAIESAARYLRTGDTSLALVGGINGNTTPECVASSSVAAAEGIVLFGVTTLNKANAAQVPVLATLEHTKAPGQPIKLYTADGTPATWLGADGALDLLAAIVRGQNVTISRTADDKARRSYALHVKSAVEGEIKMPTKVATPPTSPLPGPLQLQRHTIEWLPAAVPNGTRVPFLPQNVVLLTDKPDLVDALGALPDGARVLCLAPCGERLGWTHIEDLQDGVLDSILPADLRHIRILTSASLSESAVAAASYEALRLHDLAFLTIKRLYGALSTGGDILVLLTDAVRNAAMHPMGGLFSGLIKSLTLELPSCRQRLLCVSDIDVGVGVKKIELEPSSKGELSVAFYDGETRYALGARALLGEHSANAPLPVGEDSVIVAFGGARGITSEILKGLLPQSRSKVWLVGASALNNDADLLALDDDAFAKTRPNFIRQALAQTPGLGPVAASKRFDRLIADRTVRRTIDTFKAVCGADRVRYVAADVLDASALEALAARIMQEDGRVDFLINAAGLGHSATIEAKTLTEFRSIRDVKARGYLNLRAAFAKLPPKLWCNFGSLIGLTGQSGEADYASGNDFLNANSFWNKNQGMSEFTIGWTLWGEIGMASNTLLRAFYESSDFYTTTKPAEGVWHFLTEMRTLDRGPATVQLGVKEKGALAALLPGFLDKSAERAKAFSQARLQVRPVQNAVSSKFSFYLGRELARSNTEVAFERIFDLESDAYLQHHVVNGFATLPGTFVTEIAAEAALQIVKGHVIGFENAVFHHFLRVYDRTRPMAKKITARLIKQKNGRSNVYVRVTGDVISPSGVILKKDKLHFEMTAIVADEYPQAPHWSPWVIDSYQNIPDPYHLPKSPVLLTGPFVSTTATGITPLGKRAIYDLKLEANDPVFSRFVVPTILLDGLARVGVLHLVNNEWLPLAAPAAISQIDLWQNGNDIDFARNNKAINLYVTPPGFDLTTENAHNRFLAVDPQGQVLAQMRGVTGVITGYVHAETGAFLPPNAFDQKSIAIEAVA